MLNLNSISKIPEIDYNRVCRRAKVDTGTKCNYNCYFCYYKNRLRVKDLPFEEIKKRINKLYSLGCRDFDLSGGESSLHKDWFKILEYISRFENVSKFDEFQNSENVSKFDEFHFQKFNTPIKISCLSNGSKFSDLDFLKKSKDRGLSEILFSLHSVDGYHDKMVGVNGAFKKIIKAIENANKLDISVRLNSTITNFNAPLIDNEFLNVLNNIDFKTINFLPLNYFEEGRNNEKFDYNNLNYIKSFIDKTGYKSLKDFYLNTSKIINNFKVLESIKEPLVAVRYIPYCFFKNYENYVFSYFDHIYDLLDWNLAWYEYKNFEKIPEIIKNQRIKYYIKNKKCLHCKYINICDGFKKE